MRMVIPFVVQNRNPDTELKVQLDQFVRIVCRKNESTHVCSLIQFKLLQPQLEGCIKITGFLRPFPEIELAGMGRPRDVELRAGSRSPTTWCRDLGVIVTDFRSYE